MTTTNNTTKVITGKVRLSYAHLFEPAETPSGEEKYSVMLLIPKSDKETVGKIKAAQKAAAEAGRQKFGGKIPQGLKLNLRDGDEEMDTDERPEFKGVYFMNVSSKTRPGVVDAHLQPILDGSEVYSGCYAKASINFFAYNTAGNKGVSAGLNNIQKIADGDYLGGRTKAEDDFDVYNDAEFEVDFDELLGDE
jgi:hypothetical protein